jgi:hypothetical protein
MIFTNVDELFLALLKLVVELIRYRYKFYKLLVDRYMSLLHTVLFDKIFTIVSVNDDKCVHD